MTRRLKANRPRDWRHAYLRCATHHGKRAPVSRCRCTMCRSARSDYAILVVQQKRAERAATPEKKP